MNFLRAKKLEIELAAWHKMCDDTLYNTWGHWLPKWCNQDYCDDDAGCIGSIGKTFSVNPFNWL